MKFVSGAILSVSLLAGFLAAVPVRAEDPSAPAACEVPDYLLSGDNALPKVAEAIKAKGPLNILVVGSRSSTISLVANASEAAAYPGQMQAALKAKLPSNEVNVSVEIQAKKTAEEVAAGLAKLVESKKPTLVIWQTGTVDAMRSVDPDDFRTAVDEGVEAVQNCDGAGGRDLESRAHLMGSALLRGAVEIAVGAESKAAGRISAVASSAGEAVDIL